jgi:hypothetical protein
VVNMNDITPCSRVGVPVRSSKRPANCQPTRRYIPEVVLANKGK